MLRPLATTLATPDAPTVPQDDATARCQWCNAPLPAGTARCASCGALCATDDALKTHAVEPAIAPEPEAARADLVEWWREDDTADGPPAPRLTLADVERRRMQTFVAIGVGVVVCTVFGWLAGPLLAPALERLTGATIEHPSDLRGMGALLGFIAGMFCGATGGWIIWSGR
jgi:hypothetical protein